MWFLPENRPGRPNVRQGHATGRNAILCLSVAYAAYASFFIYRTSFVIDGQRWFSLFDDAMVSMRFAKNLAEGHGLVWNVGGARVEGFTNPLWVGVMTLVHGAGIPEPGISMCIQIIGGLCLLANVWLTARLANLVIPRSPAWSIAGAILTAFYYPLNNWGLQGMEVAPLALWTTLCAYLLLRRCERGASLLPVFALAGMGTLMRMDFAVPTAVLVLFAAWSDPARRSRPLVAGLACLSFFLLAQTALRYAYYGDILPNTYYLKMTGYPTALRITRGLSVLLTMAWRMNILIFLLPFAAAYAALRRGTRSHSQSIAAGTPRLHPPPERHAIVLLSALALGQFAYSIYVGGDAWDKFGGANRYVAIAMPLFFVLLCSGLARLETVLHAALLPGGSANGDRWAGLRLAVLVLCLIHVNAIDENVSINHLSLAAPPLGVLENAQQVECAQLIREFTTPDATVAVVWAGALPYFSGRTCFDMLGKSDATIAREPMHTTDGPERFTWFYPGHLKWNYAWTVGHQQPDVVVGLWLSPESARPLLDRDYCIRTVRGRPFYLRWNSPRIRWPLTESPATP